MLFEVVRGGFEPFQVQRLVARDPEHLLIERGAQALGGAQQLLLVQLQGDGFVEQRAQFAVQALQQFATGAHQFQQGFAQLRGDLIGRLRAEQVVHVGNRVADQFALLVDLELIQADVSDFVRQVLVHLLQTRQRLFLFVEDLGQQKAALQHADLLIQRLIALGDVVQLLFGFEVLLRDFVQAVGAAQQVVGKLEVERALGGQQAAAARLLRFQRLLGHGLLRLRQTLLVDQGLQLLNLLVLARGFFQQQVMLAAAEVLQQAVARQFLTAQRNQRGEGSRLGGELVALILGQQLAVIAAQLEGGVDLLDARLAGADFGLRPLRSGLGRDGHAVGAGQGFLQFALLRGAIRHQLLQLGHAQIFIALGHRHDSTGFESRQFALVFEGLLLRGAEQLLDLTQALFVFRLVGQLGKGLFEDRLQGLLVGVGQLSIGNFIQALLNRLGGQGFSRLQRTHTKAQAEQDGGEKRAQSGHRFRSYEGQKWAV